MRLLNHEAPKAPPQDDAELPEAERCPSCRGTTLKKWGFQAGLQRYRCKKCGATFNVLSRTPLANLKMKEKWELYAQCLLESRSIRDSAKICGIAISTAFRWRHRFLEMIEKTKPPAVQGIIEMDETKFRNSKKGDRHLDRPPRKRGAGTVKDRANEVSVLVVRDRKGTTSEYVFDKFRAAEVSETLGDLIPPDSVVCTDGSTVLESFAKQKGYHQMAVVASAGQRVLAGPFHIQNVNAYHKRMKEWMIRFHGVSTKWLSRYMGWRRMLDNTQNDLSPSQVLCYAIG